MPYRRMKGAKEQSGIQAQEEAWSPKVKRPGHHRKETQLVAHSFTPAKAGPIHHSKAGRRDRTEGKKEGAGDRSKSKGYKHRDKNW
jgi:hypothetical protein